MKPVIKKLEEMTVVGKVIKTTMKDNKIPQLWNEFNTICDQIQHVVEKGVALGLCFPMEKEECTENDEFLYMASVQVSAIEEMPEGLIERKIPACSYAVFTHKGPLDTLQQTYKEIFSEGMEGLSMAKADEIEWYGREFKYGEKDSIMFIYVPIRDAKE